MKSAPSKAEQLGAIAILACVIGLVALFVILPVSAAVRDTQDQIAHNQALIARLSAHVDAPRLPEAYLTSLQSRILRQNRYLNTNTEPLTAAVLQQHIKGLLR